MYTLSTQTLLYSSLLLLPAAAKDVATTITYSQAPSSTPASPQYTDPSTLQSAALNSTNVFRHQHNAPDLVWNDTVAQYARDHVKSCKFEHTDGPYGENLAQGYPDMSSSIDGWGFERDDYDFSGGDFTAGTGHFTQLVWKSTTDLGCGAKYCDWGWLVFCEYWPAGNVIGHFEDQVEKQVNSDVNTTSMTASGKGGSGGGRGSDSGDGSPDSAASLVGMSNGLVLLLSVVMALLVWIL